MTAHPGAERAACCLLARSAQTIELDLLAFTLMGGISANPTSGSFSNLPEGGIATANGKDFQASYSGSDGNDLTLTVVP